MDNYKTGDGTNLTDGVVAKRSCSHTSNPPNTPQLAPVPGQRFIEFGWQLLGLLDERRNHRLSLLIGHLRQHHVTGMTLDQGRDMAVLRS